MAGNKQCRATLPPSLSSSPAATRLAPYIWTHQYTHLCPSHCFVLDDGTGKAVGYVIGCPDVFAFASAYGSYVDRVLAARGAEVRAPRQMERREEWTVPVAVAVPAPLPAAESGGVGGGEEEAGTGTASTTTPTTTTTVMREEVNEECLLQMVHNPNWLLLEGVEGKAELVAAYRATMHIDMLPPFQGRGWGRKLIARFVDSVRRARGGRLRLVREPPYGEEEGEEEEEEVLVLDHGKGIHIGISGENTKVVPFYEKVGFRVYPGGEREGGNVWMVYDL